MQFEFRFYMCEFLHHCLLYDSLSINFKIESCCQSVIFNEYFANSSVGQLMDDCGAKEQWENGHPLSKLQRPEHQTH